MRRILAPVLLVATAALLPFAPAPSRAQTSTTTSLSEVSWLTGHWAGKTAKGEHIEEMWMADQGGMMIGSFRWQRPDGRWLFEFMQLLDTPAAISPFTLRIKHFNRDFRGMEDKDASTSLMVKERTATRLVFEMKEATRVVQVGYERKGADALLAWFDEQEPGKSPVHIEFPYTRLR
jgi:hypothetical protein